mmetsp:Transcript_105631/g.336342  ORF Transcript_105631/g.336342 Transcript_105631/m.336342 type:complete len:212 (+) Transcript_105631:780-1415(+)
MLSTRTSASSRRPGGRLCGSQEPLRRWRLHSGHTRSSCTWPCACSGQCFVETVPQPGRPPSSRAATRAPLAATPRGAPSPAVCLRVASRSWCCGGSWTSPGSSSWEWVRRRDWRPRHSRRSTPAASRRGRPAGTPSGPSATGTASTPTPRSSGSPTGCGTCRPTPGGGSCGWRPCACSAGSGRPPPATPAGAGSSSSPTASSRRSSATACG